MRVTECCHKRQSLHMRSRLAPNLIIFAPTQFQPSPRNQRARRRWRGPPWSLKLSPRSLTLKWNGSATQRTLSRAADTRSPLTATGTRCPSETSPRKTRTAMPWLPGGQRSSSTWKSYQSQVGDFDAAAARWKKPLLAHLHGRARGSRQDSGDAQKKVTEAVNTPCTAIVITQPPHCCTATHPSTCTAGKTLKKLLTRKKKEEIQLNYAIFILTHWRTNDFELNWLTVL